ncbi:hypothetical protein ACFO9Q_04120 [Paenibacillus sp. GCM10023252]|uniref:hypothetical protein n=1 Tax=Paenibacillus sp. GCM10023252 TaxID=3252649 RepID=UPI003609A339
MKLLLSYPMISWLNVGATIFVLLMTALLLGSMYMFIRISTDDSGKHSQLREMVETLFGTPAHLRPGSAESAAAEGSTEGLKRASGEPFREPCPACSEIVTEEHAECPSCGLRLQ